MQSQPPVSFQQERRSVQSKDQRPYSRKSSTSSNHHHPPSQVLRKAKPAHIDTSTHDAGVDADQHNQRTPPPKRKPSSTRTSIATRSAYSGRSRSASSVRNFHDIHRDIPPSVPQSPRGTSFADLPADQAREILSNLDWTGTPAPDPAVASKVHARNYSDPVSPPEVRPSPLSRMTTANQLQRSNSARLEVQTSEPNKQQASSKISSFFGWRGGNAASAAATPTTPIADSSPTTISSDSEHSPYGRSPTTFASSVKSVPPQIDVTKANNGATSLLSANFMAPPTPAMASQLDEMEDELKDLSSELAASIRREMELEDEVERLQIGGERGRRTSDYFSDSAASSVKDAGGRNAEEELEKLKRQTQQEKAQMKLDLAQKLEQERGKRKTIEEHVQTLQSHVADLEKNGAPQGNDRLQELERRLTEEREMKQNYEDLLNALKGDLTRHQNERDNLRDEIVPQLRARVDGLETELAQFNSMEYENSKMELQAGKGGLSRAASMRKGLTRSGSVSAKQQNLMQESKETLAERVKDSEAQRDALHRALKSLLDRQKLQQKEHEKRVNLLEIERDSAIDASSPRRRAYAEEVKDLRHEVNTLRNRAEDAVESKWQCEKNLSGLKMNLDRAEQETASLRELLKQNDILIPDLLPGQLSSTDANATSVTLARAYKELRDAQAMSITQLKEISGLDGETTEALDALLKSLNDTKAERDFHITQAEQYKAQAQSLYDVRSFNEMENQSMATQLEAGAARIKQLNNQVQSQLASNNSLRERLTYAVSKGEREQRENTERITTLQGRLRALEDKLVNAQAHSEEKIQENEDVVRNMTKSNNPQVTRVSRVGRKSILGGTDSKSPIMASTPGIKTPLGPKIGQGQSLSDAMRTEYLEGKVAELEKALAETDKEMQEVVHRMNMAQIEVLDLQSQRDEAIKQTRSLQESVQMENKNMGGLMARMMGR